MYSGKFSWGYMLLLQHSLDTSVSCVPLLEHMRCCVCEDAVSAAVCCGWNVGVPDAMC